MKNCILLTFFNDFSNLSVAVEPGTEGKKLPSSKKGTDVIDFMSPEERAKFLQNRLKVFAKMHAEYKEECCSHPTINEIYRPAVLLSYNRANGYDDAPLVKQTALEIEEDYRQFLAERMRDKKLDVSVGTPKHWQVVDEEVYGKGSFWY